tara:strand:- start:1245 stop:4406 length:3162 start_codon:yes stop_codon:yes gene_type:complete
MVNPLILPPSRPALMAMLGREHREAKRQQQDEKILRAALAIVQRHAPGMVQTPPDASGFDDIWPQIDQSLQQEMISEGAYRHAYSFLCRQLEAGNRQGIWSVQVPEPYLTLRRRRPARTLRWHGNSRLVAEAEHHWCSNLNSNPVAPDILFARLLLSMVFYGGLNRPELWPAMAHTLSQPRPLRGDNTCCWLVLEPAPGRSLASNLYKEEQDSGERLPHCEVLYMPDPVSLGLLRQFLQQKPKDWQPPTTPDACLAMMNQVLSTRFTRTQLASGGITVAEHLEGVALPQVLVEYATGRQPSASLPYCYWQRLLRPSLQVCEIQLFEPFTRFPVLSRRPARKQAGQRPRPYLLPKLREIFHQDRARPRGKSAIISELQALNSDTLSLPEAALVNWLLHHLEDKGNAISTAKRYFEGIAREWLTATDHQDLLSYSGEEFHDLYLSILNRPRSQKDREYRAGRLEDLHLFGVQQHGFPPLPEPLQEGSDTLARVSAAIVDEPLFSALLKQFQGLRDLGENMRRMYLCFLIIAYRTGLRPGEIAKLRLGDIEPSPIAWLFVRNNKHGSNKTEAALRKVPLFPLLTPEEKALVDTHLGERRLHSRGATELLFHQPENPHEPLDTTPLSLAVGTILGALSSGLSYRLYHLRHSAFSRLQLLLHADRLALPAPVDALLPYSQAQRQEIRMLIVGQGRQRDRYHALAAFAGHSSPDTTFSTYLHFSDLILGLHLQQHQRDLNATQAQAWLGLRPHRIRQRLKKEQSITPANTAGYLRKRLARHFKPVSPQKAARVASETAPLQSGSNNQYDPMLAVLEKIQNGHDHREAAWFYRLTPAQIQRWHESALALRALVTEKQRPRLFPRSRRHQLLPPRPVDVGEKRDIQAAVSSCRNLYAAMETRDAFLWMVRYTLTHCNSSRSGIRFDDPETFRRYMSIASQLFDWPRWRLKLRYTDEKAIKPWRCGPLEVQLYVMKQHRRFDQGSGWLLLRHREETARTEPGKTGYASHSLRILLHRLAIILFTAEEIATWQAQTEPVGRPERADRMLNEQWRIVELSNKKV